MKYSALKEYGFDGFKDLFGTVFCLKTLPFLNLQIVGTILTSLLSFWQNWIWNPPGAAFFVIGLTIGNFILGLYVNLKYKKEAFSMDKVSRTATQVLADIILMSCLNIMIKYFPYWSLAADGLFGYFFTYKMHKIWVNFGIMKVQDPKAVGFFADYFKTKFTEKTGVPAPETAPETAEVLL